MTTALHFRTMNRHRRNGNYPQWMRTLEQKYQKLHKKIIDNNGVRFQNSFGNSVHENRLSYTLLQFHDMSLQRTHCRSTSTAKDGTTNHNKVADGVQKVDTMENNKNINITNEGDDGAQTEDIIENNAYKTIEGGAGDTGSIDNEKVEKIIQKKSIWTSPETGITYTYDHLEQSSQCPCKPKTSKCSNDLTSKNSITYGLQSADELVLNSIACDTDKTNAGTDVEKLENNKPTRSDLKTSKSRTSKVTSKSCPAEIQSRKLEFDRHESIAHKSLLSIRNSTNKNVNTKMITPMSVEATYAIIETIQEMNLNIHGEKGDCGIQFIPSSGRRCVKSWTMTKKSSHDVSSDLENVSKSLAVSDSKEPLDERCFNDNRVSCLSESSFPEDAHQLNSKLPYISIGSARDRSSCRSQSYRISGIGKYDIEIDDPVFEITPPGFDSRYNRLLLTEGDHSETPPPDVRQKAIEKCSEWLVKCNK